MLNHGPPPAPSWLTSCVVSRSLGGSPYPSLQGHEGALGGLAYFCWALWGVEGSGSGLGGRVEQPGAGAALASPLGCNPAPAGLTQAPAAHPAGRLDAPGGPSSRALFIEGRSCVNVPAGAGCGQQSLGRSLINRGWWLVAGGEPADLCWGGWGEWTQPAGPWRRGQMLVPARGGFEQGEEGGEGPLLTPRPCLDSVAGWPSGLVGEACRPAPCLNLTLEARCCASLPCPTTLSPRRTRLHRRDAVEEGCKGHRWIVTRPCICAGAWPQKPALSGLARSHASPCRRMPLLGAWLAQPARTARPGGQLRHLPRRSVTASEGFGQGPMIRAAGLEGYTCSAGYTWGRGLLPRSTVRRRRQGKSAHRTMPLNQHEQTHL